jgi:hypothetical protein
MVAHVGPKNSFFSKKFGGNAQSEPGRIISQQINS